MRIAAGVATDIGQVREGNEDAYLAAAPLYAVADGIGGHRGGEVASQLALETVEARYGEGASLEDAVRSANGAVFERSSHDRAVAGMGTTMTAAVIEPSSAHLVHVGDSRAYLFRAGALRRLTRDHTLMQQMIDAGEITPEAEAEVHPHRNVLLRSLGTDPDVDLDVQDVGLLEGDRLIICSDGLTSMITEEQAAAIAAATPVSQDAAERLVRAANRAGGIDNITVLVLDVVAEEGTADGAVGVPEAEPRRTAAAAEAAPPPAWRGPVVRIAVALVVLLAGFAAFRTWLDGRWYVGVADGYVAIYRGIPVEVLGFELSRVEVQTQLPADEVEALPLYEDLADGINVDSREEAQQRIDQMEQDLRDAEKAAKGDGGGGEAPVSTVAPRRRGRGLPLLLVGAAAGIFAYVLQGLGLREAVPDDAVAFGIGFVVIAVAGWIGMRIAANDADPVLYPVAVFLGGLGLAMLFRIMDARGFPEIAQSQMLWFAIGVGCFLAVLFLIRDIRQLDAYTYTLGLIGIVLLLLPIMPSDRADRRAGGERRAAVVPGRWPGVPARRVRTAVHRRVPRLVPGSEARAAGRRDGSLRAPPREGPGAGAAGLGRVARRPVPGARHGRVPAAVRRVRGDALGRDRAARLPGARPGAVPPRRRRRVRRVRPRAAAGGRVAARDGPRHGQGRRLPAGAGLVRARDRRDGRHGPRPRIAHADPVRRAATSSWPRSARSWGCSASRRCCSATSS